MCAHFNACMYPQCMHVACRHSLFRHKAIEWLGVGVLKSIENLLFSLFLNHIWKYEFWTEQPSSLFFPRQCKNKIGKILWCYKEDTRHLYIYLPSLVLWHFLIYILYIRYLNTIFYSQWGLYVSNQLLRDYQTWKIVPQVVCCCFFKLRRQMLSIKLHQEWAHLTIWKCPLVRQVHRFLWINRKMKVYYFHDLIWNYPHLLHWRRYLKKIVQVHSTKVVIKISAGNVEHFSPH